MNLEITVIVFLVFLITKELLGAMNSNGAQRIAQFLIVPIIPLLIILVILAVSRLTEMTA